MTAQDRKTEELIAKAFQTMLEQIIKTETKWNGAIIKGIAEQSKWIGVTSASITTSKEKTKQSRLAIKEIDKEILAKRDSTEENKKLIKFRSIFNIAREKEHGAQVRRNKELQHQLNSTGNGLQFLTNSIKGNFGFQSALGNITKSLMNGRASFDSLEKNTVMLADAQKRLDDVNKQVFPDPDEKKMAEADVKGLEKEKENIKNRGIGTGKSTKPLFNILSKMGKFMEKKALPIGLGIGVAGILMSVIVKSFSASPLFAQMMKMIKFMVTLILMPIGTFFGALLRPILISLLRKVIVPLYATWMPAAMKWGTALGNWLNWDFGGREETDKELIEMGEGAESFKKGESGLAKWLEDWIFHGINPWDNPDFDPSKHSSTLATMGLSTFGSGVGSDVDNSIPDAGHSNASDYDLDVNDVLKTEDEKVLEAIQLVDYHEGERARIALEEEERLAAEAAAEAAKVKKEEDRLAAVAENQTNYDNASPARKEILDQQEAARIANEKRAADNDAAMSGSPAAVTTTYAEERQAEYDNMTGFSREDGGDNSRSEYELDIVNREKQQAEHDEKQRIENERVAAIHAEDKFSNEQSEVFESNIIGGLGEHAGKTWQDYIPAADGFSGMVNKPTMFLAGEAGSEHVSITPSGGSGGGGITVNIQNMNGSDNDLRKLKQTILEVIQQSSANRGRL